MVLLHPEQGTAEKKGSNLVPTVVEDVALPFRVETALGIGVLKEMGAVEIPQPVFIIGKM